MTIEGLGAQEQYASWKTLATDPRPRVSTGWAAVDDLLHRGSLAPGTFCILGGRMHTRKTTVMMNLIANLLSLDVPTGLVALDESVPMYVAKLASVLTGKSHSLLEEQVANGDNELGRTYEAAAHRLSITRGYRPGFEDLTKWLNSAEVTTGARPRVVFIDYLSLMARAKFTKGEAERVMRLAEDLQVWTNDNAVVTIALHQVGRTDEGNNRKYHGDQPLNAEQLKYGGEEMADLVFGTFRPEQDPIGNMSQAQALAEGIDQDEWQEHADRVVAMQGLTFLQLLKNRPGTKLERKGIALRSQGESQLMVPTDQEVNDSMELTA